MWVFHTVTCFSCPKVHIIIVESLCIQKIPAFALFEFWLPILCCHSGLNLPLLHSLHMPLVPYISWKMSPLYLRNKSLMLAAPGTSLTTSVQTLSCIDTNLSLPWLSSSPLRPSPPSPCLVGTWGVIFIRFFSSAEDWARVPTHTRQTLYPWATSPAIHSFVLHCCNPSIS